jgi:hypothetical protein
MQPKPRRETVSPVLPSRVYFISLLLSVVVFAPTRDEVGKGESV